MTVKTANGIAVKGATIIKHGSIYQAVIVDVRGNRYVSGSNSRTLAAERKVLAGMYDHR